MENLEERDCSIGPGMPDAAGKRPTGLRPLAGPLRERGRFFAKATRLETELERPGGLGCGLRSHHFDGIESVEKLMGFLDRHAAHRTTPVLFPLRQKYPSP
ncbi:hypothetical protein [Rhodobium gokarnense]|uniref:Transposase n=1 Tax=Rhodobium gokarnense TaxID=364296 RepID=A0ABT3HDQ1_9HYPH|nr:hypothetical protein [Rhodobium gokarnense]MCW2308535.1 hypothetical protein [Rhodobium gokarnense]